MGAEPASRDELAGRSSANHGCPAQDSAAGGHARRRSRAGADPHPRASGAGQPWAGRRDVAEGAAHLLRRFRPCRRDCRDRRAGRHGGSRGLAAPSSPDRGRERRRRSLPAWNAAGLLVRQPPVNAKVAHWTAATLPANWPTYRDIWETAHAVSSVLAAVATVALLVATVWAAPTGQDGGQATPPTKRREHDHTSRREAPARRSPVTDRHQAGAVIRADLSGRPRPWTGNSSRCWPQTSRTPNPRPWRGVTSTG
jgi:hypothetical protein